MDWTDEQPTYAEAQLGAALHPSTSPHMRARMLSDVKDAMRRGERPTYVRLPDDPPLPEHAFLQKRVAALMWCAMHEREGLMIGGLFAFLLGDQVDHKWGQLCEHRLPLIRSTTERYWRFDGGTEPERGLCVVCGHHVETARFEDYL